MLLSPEHLDKKLEGWYGFEKTEKCELCGNDEPVKEANGYKWEGNKKVSAIIPICQHCIDMEREYDNVDHETEELITLRS